MEENLIRIGSVSSINYEAGTIRVTYPDLDDSVTDDFPVLHFGGKYKMPDIGEDVLVLHLSNGTEVGFVAGSYWTDDDPPAFSGPGVFLQEFAAIAGVAYALYKDKKLRIKAPQIILETDAGEVDVDTLIEAET